MKEKNSTDTSDKPETEQNEEIKDEKFFSDKKTIIKFICFIIAVVVASSAIGYGVYRIGYKEEGIYEIECDVDKDAPHFSTGITFKYDFKGSSSEIKTLMRQIKLDYTDTLKTFYKLTDADNTYLGITNIAAVNQTRGEYIEISDELFEILSDAYDKTLENSGYDMFSGAASKLRDSTVYSFDPEERDPALNEETGQIVETLYSIMSKEDSVVFKLDKENKTVFFDISDEYKAFIEEYELDSAIIDLERLRDAYILKYVVRMLENKGYNDGYITTNSGLSLLLSQFGSVDYCLYSRKSEDVLISATKQGKGGTCCSSFRMFALSDDEYGFYVVEKDGKTLYRSKYMQNFSFDPVISASICITSEFNAVEAAYANVMLFGCRTPDDTVDVLSKLTSAEVLYELNEQNKAVYSNTEEGIMVNAANGYFIAKIGQ